MYKSFPFSMKVQQKIPGFLFGKDELCVRIVNITFQNPENGYSVIRTMEISGDEEVPVTIVGSLYGVQTGVTIKVNGEWQEHKKYGYNFSVSSWVEIIPETKEGVEQYLASGLFKGIGKSTAKMIVDRFGADSITVIENEPHKLLTITGIGTKKLDGILESWKNQRGIKDVMMFLQSNGVSINLAVKIYKKYGNDSLPKLRENPYRLANDLWGVGFKTADRVALNMGIAKNSPKRIASGLEYALKEMAGNGDVCAEPDELLKKASELLGTDGKENLATLNAMVQKERLTFSMRRIYLPYFYTAEKETARLLARISKNKSGFIANYEVDFEKLESETGMEYDEVQRHAITTSVKSKVMILTGGPGTGKTTTTNGIIKTLMRLGKEVKLAAPTGRAAKRLQESSNMEAKTIHRLLEYNPQDGFARDETNPIDADVVIVDEASMIDCVLMYALIRAIPDEAKIILVGDVDQLPSVGAGNVLLDLIKSRAFDVVRLTKIFRQAQTSRIVTNAHLINSGHKPTWEQCSSNQILDCSGDFVFVEQEDANIAADEVVHIVRDVLPRKFDGGATQIQVLSPMRNGGAGTNNLNALMQDAINNQPVIYNSKYRRIKMNDKVMQIRNNYEKGVFNGDIGFVRAYTKDDEGHTEKIGIDFGGGIVYYDIHELDEVVLAYATTIHKSQGSEYPVVVMPILTSHFIMLQRNLLYTGVTRAKKLLILVGNKKAIGMAIRNVTITKRNTRLAERISNEMSKDTN